MQAWVLMRNQLPEVARCAFVHAQLEIVVVLDKGTVGRDLCSCSWLL